MFIVPRMLYNPSTTSVVPLPLHKGGMVTPNYLIQQSYLFNFYEHSYSKLNSEFEIQNSK